MRVEVDDDRCGGHGVCMGLCPEVFDLAEDGYAVVLLPEVPPEHQAAVRAAANQCPTHAVRVS
ncbi:MAG TPA: ferredoxin [Acidimicrobiales bacterium]